MNTTSKEAFEQQECLLWNSTILTEDGKRVVDYDRCIEILKDVQNYMQPRSQPAQAALDVEMWRYLAEFIKSESVEKLSTSVTRKAYAEGARELSISGLVGLVIREVFWKAEQYHTKKAALQPATQSPEVLERDVEYILETHENALRDLYKFCVRGTNNPSVAENSMLVMRQAVKDLAYLCKETSESNANEWEAALSHPKKPVDGKPLELMTRDELLWYIESQKLPSEDEAVEVMAGAIATNYVMQKLLDKATETNRRYESLINRLLLEMENK